MKTIHILVSVFTSLTWYPAATAAPLQQSSSSTQPTQVEIHPSGNAETANARTTSYKSVNSEIGSCVKKGVATVGCSTMTSQRSRHATRKSDANSDPRRWVSTLGF